METTITRAMMAVRHSASDDQARPHLNAVRIEGLQGGGGTAVVATNGHTLSAVLDPTIDCGVDATIEAASFDAIAKAAGAAKKGASAQLVIAPDAGLGAAKVTTGITVTTAVRNRNDGFPSWRHLFSQSKPAQRVTVRADYLIELAKAALEFHAASGTAPGDAVIELQIHSALDPIEIRAKAPIGPRFAALLMPYRGDEKGPWDPTL